MTRFRLLAGPRRELDVKAGRGARFTGHTAGLGSLPAGGPGRSAPRGRRRGCGPPGCSGRFGQESSCVRIAEAAPRRHRMSRQEGRSRRLGVPVGCPAGLAATGVLPADPAMDVAARELWGWRPAPVAEGPATVAQCVRRCRSGVGPHRWAAMLVNRHRGHVPCPLGRRGWAADSAPARATRGAQGRRGHHGSGAPRDRL